MKKARMILLLPALCLLLSGCGVLRLAFYLATADKNADRTAMGFDPSEFAVVHEEDTHGGFHGDGYTSLILDCSSASDKALSLVSEWTPLPLSENLELIMYGGVRDGVTYGYELAEEAHWPHIEHGYYRFNDRQSEDPSDDSGLFGRYSFHFELAVYDTDSHTLYYFKFDT